MNAAIRICAWCQAVLAWGTFPATHGVCPACFARLLAPTPDAAAGQQPAPAGKRCQPSATTAPVTPSTAP